MTANASLTFFEIKQLKSMKPIQASTLFTLPEDLGFVFPDTIPFNTAPRQGVKQIQGSFLYTLRIQAVPTTKKNWQEKLTQGNRIRFVGVQKGTNMEVQFDAEATKSKFSPRHLIVKFHPVT